MDTTKAREKRIFDWQDRGNYHKRTGLVLNEFEAVLGIPVRNELAKSFDHEEIDTVGDETIYIYDRIAHRVADKIKKRNNLAYFAITGDAETIDENKIPEDITMYWQDSLGAIKDNTSKEDIIEALNEAAKDIRMLEEIRLMDLYAIKIFEMMVEQA